MNEAFCENLFRTHCLIVKEQQSIPVPRRAHRFRVAMWKCFIGQVFTIPQDRQYPQGEEAPPYQCSGEQREGFI